MVQFNAEKQEGDLIYESDVKIKVPKQLKLWICSEMLHIGFIDIESKNKLSDYDSLIELNGIKIEWKNGRRWMDGTFGAMKFHKKTGGDT
jgi:hypothetical protein